MNNARRLTDFEGDWQVCRDITPQNGPAARFEGTAQWRAVTGGMQYKEYGLMTLPGAPAMQAERRYFWNTDLSVFFEDGRLFHAVPPEGGQAHHWCPPDDYTIVYDFTDWPLFRVHWTVKGPRKDYRAITYYERRARMNSCT